MSLMRIGIFFIRMNTKEMDLGGNEFGTRENILGLIIIDESQISFKRGGLNIAVFEAFIKMCYNVFTYRSLRVRICLID